MTFDVSLNQTGLSQKEIIWDTPLLDHHALILRAKLETTFKYAFQADRTEDFMSWMTDRLDNQANVVGEAIGRTGSGKSYTILTLGCITDPKWTPQRNVHYSLEDILSSEYKNDMPVTWNLDEVARTWGVGSWRSHAEWENYVESIRKKQHSIFTATPTRKPMGTTMWCLEPLRMSRRDEVVQLAISNAKGHTMGYVIISHPKHFMSKKMLQSYEDMKDNYIGSILSRKGRDNVTDAILTMLEKYPFSLEREKNIVRVSLHGNVLTTTDLVELVNENYPHLQRNNEAYAIAEGIKSKLKMMDIEKQSL